MAYFYKNTNFFGKTDPEGIKSHKTLGCVEGLVTTWVQIE